MRTVGNDILVIPDLHGRPFWREAALGADGRHIVFLGDYADPFPDEGLSPEQALAELEAVISLKREHPDKTSLLLGNHDLQYLWPDFPKTRFDERNARRYASLYMENVYGVKTPRVALLNVGKEAEKGDDMRRETYRLLQETPSVNFVGNMESRDLLSGRYDVVVADGFSGNVLVKTTEGTALELLKKIKKDIFSRWIYKLGALLMSRMFKDMKAFMNYQNYGGSVLLGTSKVVVKGHGSSKAVAVEKCIEQAYKMEVSRLSGKIETEIGKYEHYEE